MIKRIKKLTLSGNKISIKQLLLVLITVPIIIFLVFTYSVNQKSADLYVKAVMGAPQDVFVAIPYWVANSINKGDKELSPMGKVNAEVLDVESYEGGSHGKHAIIDLLIKAVKDKDGIYYYKNQPLEVNKWFDLKIGSVDEKVYITYLNIKPPKKTIDKIKITVKKEAEIPYITANLNINDEMLNNKSEVMAKITAKKISPAIIRTYNQEGNLLLSSDSTRNDIELIIDVMVSKYGDLNYFGELRKVKIGEKIDFFFNKATLWDGIIISVNEI